MTGLKWLRLPSGLIRRWWPGRRRLSAGSLALVLAGLTAAGLMQVRVDTSVESALPAGDPATRAVEDKAEAYGGEPIVVLLESEHPRELLQDQEKLGRLLQLEGRLAQLPDVASVYGPATVLNQIAGAAQGMLAQISGRRDALSHQTEQRARASGASDAAVQQAVRDAVAQFDRRYAALLAQGLPAGLPTLRNPDFVTAVTYDAQGQPRSQWRFVHPNTNTVAILVRPRANLDQSAAGRLGAAVREAAAGSKLGTRRVTVTGVPVLTAALTERTERESPVLGGLAVIAVGLVFFLAPWSRTRRSRLRPLVAALAGTALTMSVFGWLGHPVSLGMAAFLPVLVGIGSDFPFYLSQPGHRRSALVAALAAAAGFGALALSPLPFVGEFGLAVAAGILVTVGVAVVMRRTLGVVAPPGPGEPRVTRERGRPELWKRVAVLVAAAAVAVLGVGALPRLGIETSPDQLARGLPQLADARYAEDVLRSSAEVSLVLRGKDVTEPAALAWARQAEDIIVREHGDQMRPVITMSGLLAFLGREPSAEQVRAGLELLPPYLSSAVLRPDRSEALMTFGTQVDDLEQKRALLQDVRSKVPPAPPGFESEIVGLPVAGVRGLELVSGDRSLINLAGIAAAGVVLAVGLRSLRDAARAVLAVVLAGGCVLALAWLAIGSLSPLTVAIGSLTVATGCEFVVMLTAACRRRDRRLRRSVDITALAGTVGYLVLGLSGVAVLRDFGLLLAVGVVSSYLAARLVVWVFPPSPAAKTVPERGFAEMKGVTV